MGEEKLRQNVRLRTDQNNGTVMLRRGSAPPVPCRLLDLSEMGCKCLAPFDKSQWPESANWKNILQRGEIYQLEIVFEPHLANLQAEGEIRSVILVQDCGIEVGFLFKNLAAAQRTTLGQSLLTIATEKIKASQAVLKRSLSDPAPSTAPASAGSSMGSRRTERPRRKTPRYRIALPVSYQFCTNAGVLLDKQSFMGVTADLSETGLQITGPLLSSVGPDEFRKGTVRMTLRISVMSKEVKEIAGLCDIRHCKELNPAEGGRNAVCAFGLHIAQMESGSRETLIHILMRAARGDTQGMVPPQ